MFSTLEGVQILALEEYGLRCLLQVAFHKAPGPMTIAEIARAEGLSPEYVGKIMRTLRLGELVVSTRGAAGGYRLARPGSEISIWQAMLVLGGELFPEGFCDCHPGRRRDCVHSTDCSVRAVWRSLQHTLEQTLEGISLEDLRRDEGSMVVWLEGGDSNREGAGRWS